MLRFSTLTILALAAGFVAGQATTASGSSSSSSASASSSDSSSAAAPTSTSAISPCILTCSTQATGCSGPTDLPCVCTNTTYQQAVLTCIQQQCPDQVAAATQLQGATCAAATSSGATNGTSTGSSSSSSSASTTRPTTSAPAATSSGAAFKNAPVAPAMGAFAAFIGAAIF